MLFGVILGLGRSSCSTADPAVSALLRLSVWSRTSARSIPGCSGISLLSMPILPMSYVYAIYKHHLGALEFRANRLLGVYSFSALCITSYVVALFLVSSRWAPVDDDVPRRRPRHLAGVRLGPPFLREPLPGAGGPPHLRHPAHAGRGHRHRLGADPDSLRPRGPGAGDRRGDPADLLIRQSALYLFEGADGWRRSTSRPCRPASRRRRVEELARAARARAGAISTRRASRRPASLGPAGDPPEPPGRDHRRLADRPARPGRLLSRRGDIHLLSTVANQIAPDGREHPPLRAGAAGDRPAQGRRGGDPAQRGALPQPVRGHPRGHRHRPQRRHPGGQPRPARDLRLPARGAHRPPALRAHLRAARPASTTCPARGSASGATAPRWTSRSRARSTSSRART